MENKSTVTASLRITENVKEKLDEVLTQIGGKNATEKVEQLLDLYKKNKQTEIAEKGLDIKSEMMSLETAMENIRKIAYGIQAKANTYAQQIDINLNQSKQNLTNTEREIEEKIKDTMQAMTDDTEKIIIENMGLKIDIEQLNGRIKLMKEERIVLEKEFNKEKENREKLEAGIERAHIAQKVAEEREIKALEENKIKLEENKELILKVKNLENSLELLDTITRERDKLTIEVEAKNKENLKFAKELQKQESKIDSLNTDMMDNAVIFKNESKELQEKIDKTMEEKHKLELELAVLKAKDSKEFNVTQ